MRPLGILSLALLLLAACRSDREGASSRVPAAAASAYDSVRAVRAALDALRGMAGSGLEDCWRRQGLRVTAFERDRAGGVVIHFAPPGWAPEYAGWVYVDAAGRAGTPGCPPVH